DQLTGGGIAALGHRARIDDDHVGRRLNIDDLIAVEFKCSLDDCGLALIQTASQRVERNGLFCHGLLMKIRIQPIKNETPPNGVMAPSHLICVTDNKYREPENNTIP